MSGPAGPAPAAPAPAGGGAAGGGAAGGGAAGGGAAGGGAAGGGAAGGGRGPGAHRRRLAIRGGAGLAVGAVAGVVVLGPLLGRGFALSYDMVVVPRPPVTATVLGTDGSVPRAVPTDLVVALLGRVVPADLVQQALLLAVFALGGWGVARLVPGRAGGAAAALAYTWNPWVAERLVLGHWAFLLGYAVLPWVSGAALAVRRGGTGLPPLLLWLAGAALAGSTSAVIATGVALAVLGARPPGRLAAVGAYAVAVSAPWLVPSLTRPGGIPADAAGVDAFAARADSPLGLPGSLLTLGGIWNPAVWPPERSSALLAGAALAGVLAAVSLGLRPMVSAARAAAVAAPGGVAERHAVAGSGVADRDAGPATVAGRASSSGATPGVRGLVGAGVAGLVLAAAGGLPGLRELVTAVVVHVPGGGLLRDGQKFLTPAALVVALCGGHAVARLASARRTVPYAVLLGVLPALVLPSLAWGAGGRLGAARYPASWTALREAVAQAPPGDVAVLPWRLYRRFDWNGDRVLLDPLPRLLPRRVLVNDDLPLSAVTVRGEDPRSARITDGLARGADLAETLRGAGARYAVVHRGQPGAAEAESALAGLPVRYDSHDLRLVELPGAVAAAPAPRPVLAAGLGIAGLASAGALCAALGAVRRRRLLRSPAAADRRLRSVHEMEFQRRGRRGNPGDRGSVLIPTLIASLIGALLAVSASVALVRSQSDADAPPVQKPLVTYDQR